MAALFWIFGVFGWLIALVALASIAGGGTDIQLIAAGVYGTFAVVCWSAAALIGEAKAIRKRLETQRATGNDTATADRFGPSGESR